MAAPRRGRAGVRDFSPAVHRWTGDEQRRRAGRARLADDVWVQHVSLSMVEDGREYFLRAQSPSGRVNGRPAHDRAGGAALVARAAQLAALARYRCFGSRRCTGNHRRPSGGPARTDAGHHSCRFRAGFLRAHGELGSVHIVGMADR